MTGNNELLDLVLPDEAPDLSEPCWAERFAKARVRRGRPMSAPPKVSVTMRVDPGVLDAFKAAGKGWQSRINAALRKSRGL
jgi:uncharacterized protein (DUF4415 family)